VVSALAVRSTKKALSESWVLTQAVEALVATSETSALAVRALPTKVLVAKLGALKLHPDATPESGL
jgi:hypothetical protein